jgi:hypothetical protein
MSYCRLLIKAGREVNALLRYIRKCEQGSP